MRNMFIKFVRPFLALGRFRSVQARLIVLFSLAFTTIIVAVELAGFFGIPFTSYGGSRGQRLLEAQRSLSLVADLKTDRLCAWLAERRTDVASLANNSLRPTRLTSLCHAAQKWLGDGVGRDELIARLRKHPVCLSLTARLRDAANLLAECEQIVIVDAKTGRALISTDDAHLGDDYRSRPCFTEPLKTGNEFIEDIHLDNASGRLVLRISRTISDSSGEPVAVMVAVLRAEHVLNLMAYTAEGLGDRGEAVLLNRDRWNLTQLKHPLPDGTRPRPLEHQITAEAAVRAVRGETGVCKANDYRGVPVLAAYRHIQVAPNVGWGLVVKRDQAEFFAPMREEAWAVLVIGAIGIAGVIALTVVVARSVTRPLRALEQAAHAVAEGDLTVRAPVTTVDEIGSLAEIFNGMVAQIQRDRESLLRGERLAAIGQLTASVSHEIRNPLGTIRTSFFLLVERLRGADPALETIFKRVERSIDRCDRIIADLLDYSRMRSLDRKSTDIDAWLEVALNEQELPEGITLQRNLASGTRLNIDRERLHQCIVNLLANACHAMKDGGHLTVASRREDNRLVVCVADTGCGIPVADVEKVFEPLYSTKTFGVGLGLPIVKQIVEQHGGEISVASRVGEGTTVSFWLPLPTQGEDVDGGSANFRG